MSAQCVQPLSGCRTVAGGTGGHQKDVTCVPGGFQAGKFCGFARVVGWVVVLWGTLVGISARCKSALAQKPESRGAAAAPGVPHGNPRAAAADNERALFKARTSQRSQR